MSVTVRIPTQLRPLTAGAGEVEIEALTVREAIDVLDRDHPGMRARLLDEQGTLRRFVNLFVADEDVRFLQGLDTGLPAGTTLSLIPAVAGGRGWQQGRSPPVEGQGPDLGTPGRSCATASGVVCY